MPRIQEKENSLQVLKQALRNKTLSNLYFFHGEEVFLLNHYLSEIKKRKIEPVTESFNYHVFNNETFGVQAFSEAVENLPMMAENTMVVVQDIDLFLLPDSDRERIIDTLCDVPDYCTVVFTYTAAAWKPDKRKKKLWDAIEKHGQIVEFGKQDAPELVAWITRHFSAREKKISTELCHYLIDMTGGTMTALNSEIEKICAYSGAATIVRSDIDAVVEPVLDVVVFQMTDLLGAGAYGKALLKLGDLLKLQQEPLVILGAIGSQYRRLGVARTLMDRGKGVPELMSLCGMKSYAAERVMNTARRVRPEFCRKAMELIMETDNAIKTSYDDSVRLLELLVLNLAQEAQHG